ncbi:MAG: glutathione peroxidase [Ilumatobacteraceae bacterium]
MTSMYDLTMKSITGEQVNLADYRGKVALVVNVASQCGLTDQYTGLVALHEANKAAGFSVLAFPCNQFGAQEPGTDAEVCEFATAKYSANFPMFSKIDVNGDGQAELYSWLKAESGDDSDIKWNFEKFLVDREGKVQRFSPLTKPEELADPIAEVI